MKTKVNGVATVDIINIPCTNCNNGAPKFIPVVISGLYPRDIQQWYKCNKYWLYDVIISFLYPRMQKCVNEIN